jgi:hypothetical protein
MSAQRLMAATGHILMARLHTLLSIYVRGTVLRTASEGVAPWSKPVYRPAAVQLPWPPAGRPHRPLGGAEELCRPWTGGRHAAVCAAGQPMTTGSPFAMPTAIRCRPGAPST